MHPFLLGLQAALDGPAAMLEWLRVQGVDARAALGGYETAVDYNLAAERSLTRSILKAIVHGDALHGCEYDGDKGHVHGGGCRLDPAGKKEESEVRP